MTCAVSSVISVHCIDDQGERFQQEKQLVQLIESRCFGSQNVRLGVVLAGDLP